MSNEIDKQQTAEQLLDLVGPARLRYCPLSPTPRQEAFLRLRVRELPFGGSAGSGKSLAPRSDSAEVADRGLRTAHGLRPSGPFHPRQPVDRHRHPVADRRQPKPGTGAD